jgi:hypothetical protein
MSWAGASGPTPKAVCPAPATTWYLAEGSASANVSLFYLLQNPNTASTTATVRY